MRVLVAPDSAGGTLDPAEMAAAIAAGWHSTRPDDEVVQRPVSDGGEGLLAALGASAFSGARRRVVEVADARGLATEASWLLRDDGVAVVESALACGLVTLAPEQRDPRRTTTWGVGQLLDDARDAGAHTILVGLGGSATVDGGAGALSALGVRLTVADGSGLKIGGQDLPRVRAASTQDLADWDAVDVVLLADVTDPLLDAPAVFGPQKGADEATVAHLEKGLRAWREVAERDLGVDPALALAAGSGAAGGLGYGLVAGIGARFVPGAATVARFAGLDRELAAADLVVTGEGRLDTTSAHGKVVSHVAELASRAGVRLAAVVGGVADGVDVDDVLPGALVVQAAPDGPGEDPRADVTAAAATLAAVTDPSD